MSRYWALFYEDSVAERPNYRQSPRHEKLHLTVLSKSARRLCSTFPAIVRSSKPNLSLWSHPRHRKRPSHPLITQVWPRLLLTLLHMHVLQSRLNPSRGQCPSPSRTLEIRFENHAHKLRFDDHTLASIYDKCV